MTENQVNGLWKAVYATCALIVATGICVATLIGVVWLIIELIEVAF